MSSRSENSDDASDDAGQLLYGQKRTGKSSLIAFPRVGRRSDPLWQRYRGGTQLKKNVSKNPLIYLFGVLFLDG